MIKIRHRAAVYAAFLLAILTPVTWASAPWRIEDIRVEGLQRISVGTVFNYLPVRPGEQIAPGSSAFLIRELFKTGFFQDVRLERAGDVLVVQVIERPAISEINISGNKSIESEDLLQGLKDIGLAEGRTFNRSILSRIEQELQRQFFNRGKYALRLESTVTPLERNRVAIDISIREGETSRIRSINIVGSRQFDGETLRDQFESGTSRWYDLFGSRDQYSREKLAGDLETLRSYYLDRGYINFDIRSTQVEITPDKKDIYITVNVDEGDLYRLGDIKLAGNLVFQAEELFPLIQLRRGEAFSRRQVVESTERINEALADYGYAFANVNNIPEVDETAKTVALTFFVDPGKRVYVRRINIAGNALTRDRVVRREIRQMESTWFAADRLKLSRERLQRTGYFDSVAIETPAVPGSPDQIDVDVTLQEKPSGSLLAGVGFSQSQGFLFNASISQSNFFGTGKRVTLGVNTSNVNKLYELAFQNPYHTLDGISRGFELSYRSTDYEDLDVTNYSTDEGRAGINYGFPLSETNRLNFAFNLRQLDFKLGVTPSNELLDFVDTYGDNFLDYELRTSWKHDSRDSAIFPRDGVLTELYASATVPGSDLTYFRLEYRNRVYVPLSRHLTLSGNLELGAGDGYGDTGALPLFEHFFAGGPRTVRGFQAYTLGPRDSNGDPLGGNAKMTGNLELLFPPPFASDLDSLRLAAFLDFGNVFLKNRGGFDAGEFRYASGLGLSWLSPIGALTLSLAYPLKSEDIDDTEVFQFSFGTTF